MMAEDGVVAIIKDVTTHEEDLAVAGGTKGAGDKAVSRGG